MPGGGDSSESNLVSRPVLNLICLILVSVGGAAAWAAGGSHGQVGVGIHIDYHTPPTANNGVFDATQFKIPGTLSATPAGPGQTFVFNILTQPANGTVALVDPVAGTFQFTPDHRFKAGADSFTFEAVDTHGLESNVATETLLFHVTTRAVESQLSTLPNMPVSGNLMADPAYPGEILTFQVLKSPHPGIFSLLDDHTGAFTYTPPNGFTGNVDVEFDVLDPFGGVSHSEVTHIMVTPEPPVAIGASISVQRNQRFSGTFSANTVFAGQRLAVYSIVKAPLHGTVVITDATAGKFRYTPKKNYLGKDGFKFQVRDQNNTPSTTAVIAVTIHK